MALCLMLALHRTNIAQTSLVVCSLFTDLVIHTYEDGEAELVREADPVGQHGADLTGRGGRINLQSLMASVR